MLLKKSTKWHTGCIFMLNSKRFPGSPLRELKCQFWLWLCSCLFCRKMPLADDFSVIPKSKQTGKYIDPNSNVERYTACMSAWHYFACWHLQWIGLQNNYLYYKIVPSFIVSSVLMKINCDKATWSNGSTRKKALFENKKLFKKSQKDWGSHECIFYPNILALLSGTFSYQQGMKNCSWYLHLPFISING